ncbi:insulin-like growth factor [Microplitis demolitor]|nr:insulin-like growth factor [Microplitis demolitor]
MYTTKYIYLLRIIIVILLGLLLFLMTPVESRPHQKTIRLCSKSLSDALYLVCSTRGFNEPFSNNGDDNSKAPTGPGIVEECCHRWCSYEQLEQYCKPPSN